jgi:hypothetical protein
MMEAALRRSLRSAAKFHFCRKWFMKKLLVCLILMISIQAFADDKSKVTVKSTEKNSGVVIVSINDGKRTVELNCNDGFPGCTAPKNGEYLMVKLPKNHGVYDCQNVDLFQPDADPETTEKIGEYCLIEK